MLLRRLYDPKLAQASYLLGCPHGGEALVVDPNRDVEQYLRAADGEGVRITHVTETHIHADFVSGSRELAERTGARLLLSDEGRPDWSYPWAAAAGATLLRGGERFAVGAVAVEALHTPGHTPEHLSLVVTDTDAADIPVGVFTGDFVFVGDVGRPDLLDRVAHAGGTMEAAARDLFRSLERFKQLPDHLQLWPGHGAGSACGKAIGAVPQTTLGYERRVNWAFAIEDEDEFVRAVLAGQPEPPRYFAEMKRINRDGPRTLGGFRRPERLPAARLRELLDGGAPVVDTRNPADYAAGHVAGTLNIPLNRGFTTWAGSLLPYDRDFYLVIGGNCTHCLDEAVRDLAMIGLDRVAGYFGSEVVGSPAVKDGLATAPNITAAELAPRLARGEVAVVDVRDPAEWEAGHLPGARHIPLSRLAERLGELPRDRPVVVHCQGGARSALAASLLRARGLDDVLDLERGYGAWVEAGLPVERDAAGAEGAEPSR